MNPLTLLGFLRAPKVLASIGVVVFLIVGLAMIHNAGKRAGIEADAKRTAPIIAGLNRDLGACKATLAQQSAVLDVQNAAISELERQAAEREHSARLAIAEARAKADTYRKRAERIANLKPSTSDQCKAADEILTQGLLEARQ